MRLFAFLIAFAVAVPFAYDGDMDTYHEAKEELALVRDGYLSALNVAMDDANEGDPEGWFKARDNGGYISVDTSARGVCLNPEASE